MLLAGEVFPGPSMSAVHLGDTKAGQCSAPPAFTVISLWDLLTLLSLKICYIKWCRTLKVLVPKYHNPIAGHLEQDKRLNRLIAYFNWAGIYSDVCWYNGFQASHRCHLVDPDHTACGLHFVLVIVGYATWYLEAMHQWNIISLRHKQHLRAVKKSLGWAELMAKPKKYVIRQVKIWYLWLALRQKIYKTTAITACPRPTPKSRSSSVVERWFAWSWNRWVVTRDTCEQCV